MTSFGLQQGNVGPRLLRGAFWSRHGAPGSEGGGGGENEGEFGKIDYVQRRTSGESQSITKTLIT